MNTNNLVAEVTELIGDVIEVREGQEEMNFGAAGIRTVEEEGNTLFWDETGIYKVEDGIKLPLTVHGLLETETMTINEPMTWADDNELARKFYEQLREEERQKAIVDQQNDEWYVKHRGIAYNFGAAGINVIGEDAE